MALDYKYNSGKPSDSTLRGAPTNIRVAEVVAVGKITETSDDENTRKLIERFNADEHIIRVSVPGDDNLGTRITELPNCIPLLPKNLNFVPKVGEFVMVMYSSDDEKYSDRFYIGPIISSMDKLDKDDKRTALSNFSDGVTTPTEEISKIPLARGIYDDPQNVVIDGRNNTDIVQRTEEVLIRAGKFVTNDPLKFNSENPGYIQIKSNFNLANENNDTTEKVTVTNIVSEKINLLTYKGSPTLSNNGGLTSVNKETSVAEYINDAKLAEILDEAHPLVFGDTLVEYLKLLKDVVLNHVHNGNGRKATDIIPGSTVEDFNKNAERLEQAMLSKNIRIN